MSDVNNIDTRQIEFELTQTQAQALSAENQRLKKEIEAMKISAGNNPTEHKNVVDHSNSIQNIINKEEEQKRLFEQARQKAHSEFVKEQSIKQILSDLNSDTLKAIHEKAEQAGHSIDDRFNAINKEAVKIINRNIESSGDKVLIAATQGITDYVHLKDMIARMQFVIPKSATNPNSNKNVSNLSGKIVARSFGQKKAS